MPETELDFLTRRRFLSAIVGSVVAASAPLPIGMDALQAAEVATTAAPEAQTFAWTIKYVAMWDETDKPEDGIYPGDEGKDTLLIHGDANSHWKLLVL